ncbi:hypothetical protein E0Y62_27375, partial [Cytobacillus praedii]
MKKLQRKTPDQLEFLKKFKQFSPVIDSDCTMNRICRYIESIDFGIRNVVKSDGNCEIYKRLMNNLDIEIENDKRKKIINVFNEFKKTSENLAATKMDNKINKDTLDEDLQRSIQLAYENLKDNLYSVCSNLQELV